MPHIHFGVVWTQVADPLKTPNAPLSLLKVPSRCADHRRKEKKRKTKAVVPAEILGNLSCSLK